MKLLAAAWLRLLGVVLFAGAGFYLWLAVLALRYP